MGPTGYPKMSVTSYQPTRHYIPQKQRPQKYFRLFHIRQNDGYMCCVKEFYCSSGIRVYTNYTLQL